MILKVLQFVTEYARDCWRALRYNYYSPLVSREHRLFFRIIIAAHSIEKGLSLNNPRALFGRQKVQGLMALVKSYHGALGTLPISMAVGALQGYVDFHRGTAAMGDPLIARICKWLELHQPIPGETGLGGIRDPRVSRSRNSALLRRYSSRHYADSRVDAHIISQIVADAQRAPSQCNRQATRVHCYRNKALIYQLLALQGGAGGFIDNVSNLFIVSSDLVAQGGAGSRSQGYVDGGIFSMALMLSCFEHGVLTCPLNLAVTNSKEATIARLAGIPPNERLIMMIAFGLPAEEPPKAAASPRIPCDSVLTQHG